MSDDERFVRDRYPKACLVANHDSSVFHRYLILADWWSDHVLGGGHSAALAWQNVALCLSRASAKGAMHQCESCDERCRDEGCPVSDEVIAWDAKARAIEAECEANRMLRWPKPSEAWLLRAAEAEDASGGCVSVGGLYVTLGFLGNWDNDIA